MPQDLTLYPHITVGWVLSIVASASVIAFSIFWIVTPRFRNDGWRSPTTNLIAGLVCLLFATFFFVKTSLEMFGWRSLTLNESGFVNRHLLGAITRRWESVHDIRVALKSHDLDFLFDETKIEFRDPAQAPPGTTGCCIYSFEGIWGHADKDIVKLMNEWRAKALARNQMTNGLR